MFAKAKSPIRGDKTVIDFQMVSIPVVVFSALDDKAAKFSRSRFSEAGDPIKTLQVDSGTGELVSGDQVLSRYATESGALVEVTDEEIVALASMENGMCETLGTVPAADLRNSPELFGAPVYVRAQTLKVGSKNTTPYDDALGLFLQALTLADKAIVFRYGVRGTVRTVALFGNGTGVILNPLTSVRVPPLVPSGQKAQDFVARALAILTALDTPLADVLPTGADIEAVKEYAEMKARGESFEEATLPEPEVLSDADFSDLLSLLGGV